MRQIEHYENFPVASRVLPAAIRPAVVALYRFARHADDLADEGEADGATRLAALARCRAVLDRIAADAPAAGTPAEASADPALAAIAGPLAAAVHRHALPLPALHALLDAFCRDADFRRPDGVDAVLDYCRLSANPVGRLMLVLLGADTPEHRVWSDQICTGLQLVNFCQDMAIDHARGRVYFAAAERPAYLRLARRMLDSGRPLAGSLRRRCGRRVGWEIGLTVAGGLRMLDKLEAAPDAASATPRRRTLHAGDWLRLIITTLLSTRKA